MNPADTRDSEAVAPTGTARALRLVAAVSALNVLSFVDRQLLVALAPLIIADLGLTRAEIGLLVGASFMFVYAVGTMVVGVWADRGPRPRILAVGLAVWSAGTALTATAGSMASLVAWRAVVGAGEAALPATALSMIGDSVPRRRLGLATGVFYAGVPIGFALSFVLAGIVGPRLGWKACFAVLGCLGFACSLLVMRVSDPSRRGSGPDEGTGGARPGAAAGAFAAVLGRPMVAALAVAAVLLVYTSAASQHAITWLVAERGFDYGRGALLSGLVILGGGLAGNLAIGAITDRAHRVHPAFRLISLSGVSVLGLLAAAGFYTLPPTSWGFYACWVAAQAYLLGWYGSLLAAVDERAPEGRRATAIGFVLLALNLLGMPAGPYVTGLIADRASFAQGLLWSLVPGAAGALVLALAGFAELAADRRRGGLRPRGTS